MNKQKHQEKMEKQENQFRIFDKVLIFTMLVAVYLWTERLRTAPKSKEFNQEEEDEFVEKVMEKSRIVKTLTNDDCTQFSLEE